MPPKKGGKKAKAPPKGKGKKKVEVEEPEEVVDEQMPVDSPTKDGQPASAEVGPSISLAVEDSARVDSAADIPQSIPEVIEEVVEKAAEKVVEVVHAAEEFVEGMTATSEKMEVDEQPQPQPSTSASTSTQPQPKASSSMTPDQRRAKLDELRARMVRPPPPTIFPLS